MYGHDLDKLISEEWDKIPDSCLGLPLRLKNGPCVFGCDLRPGVFDLMVADSVPGNGIRVFRPIFVGKLQNPVQVIAVVKHYSPMLGVVDIRPDFTSTRSFQLKVGEWGIECWRAQYPTNPHDPTEELRDDEQKIVTIHRSQSLDKVWMAIRTGFGIVIPENYEAISNGAWSREVQNGVRTFKDSRGKLALFWEKKGEHDDALHAMNYCYHAWHMAGLNAGEGGVRVGPVMIDRQGLQTDERAIPSRFGYSRDDEGDYYEA